MAIKSAGLMLFTRHEGEYVAWGQRRSLVNTEKKDLAESYAGGTQVTCHGKIEPQDNGDPRACILREAGEELGARVAEYIRSVWDHVFLLSEEDAEAVTYGLLVDMVVVEDIRWHFSTGGPVMMAIEDVEEAEDLREFSKEEVFGDTIAMFEDERQATLRGFKYLQQRDLAAKP